MRWDEFRRDAPALADAGARLLYQYGLGLGYLATVRKDGGPRIHPFCPILAEGGLYGLITPSPKQADLLRDGRYAIHSFSAKDTDDEFYVTGRASHIADAALEAAVRKSATDSGMSSSNDELLFEFGLERALLAIYKPRDQGPTWPPQYTRWRAPG